MITLYGHGTPNPYKVSIALEEMELPYQVKLVDMFAGETQTPEFLAVSPAGKIPAITDGNQSVCESNVILTYLAGKTEKFQPSDTQSRLRMHELLGIQSSLQGPMFGQRAHFTMFAPETVPYGIRRYEEQAAVVDTTVDRLLGDGSFFMGEDYTIVDMAFFGWYFPAYRSGYLDDAPKAVRAWYDRVAARPAVQRGIDAFPLFDLPERKVA